MENKSFKDVIKEPQNIIAIGVTIISMCALVVSIMQTRIMSEQRALMYKQAKAEVWPRLEINQSKSHQEEDYKLTRFSLNLSNAGVGPAIISDVRVSYKGKSVKNWWFLFEAFELPKEIKTFISNSPINNSIIKIGEDIVFLGLSDNLPLAEIFFKNKVDLKIEIWYKSIYGDKWKLTYESGNVETEEVDPNFTIAPEEQFEN